MSAGYSNGMAPQLRRSHCGTRSALADEQEGPESVSEIVESRVKAIRKSAKAEASEMRAAAGSVKRKGRPKKR